MLDDIPPSARKLIAGINSSVFSEDGFIRIGRVRQLAYDTLGWSYRYFVFHPTDEILLDQAQSIGLHVFDCVKVDKNDLRLAKRLYQECDVAFVPEFLALGVYHPVSPSRNPQMFINALNEVTLSGTFIPADFVRFSNL